MQLTLTILAVLTAGQGGYRLLGHFTDLSDEVMDNEGGMIPKILACSGHLGLASLGAVQFMAGISLGVLAWV